MSIYGEMKERLDQDERIIFPEMYKRHPWLYSEVLGVVYLVTDIKGESGNYDWIWDHTIARLGDKNFERIQDLQIVSKLLLVKRRSEDATEGTMISREEYLTAPDIYEIMDSCVVVVTKEMPHRTCWMHLEAYQALYDEYDLIDVGYLVRHAIPKTWEDNDV